ncbi:MAG TPA: acetyl-CoA C-acyltransferase [Thermoanaerobaculia bacterium]|jgi:acetyl-CoA C-acetyltransferase|nr:acetyl-CoA C-acyltransferase [Thermoanaerobaculia bacterium]
MDDVVILSAVRTPIGTFQGALSGLPAHALGARAIAAAIERAGLTPEEIQQVNMGCVLTAGQGQAPARQAALGAGCPVATGAITLNKVCGSGMRAVMIAANDLRCGDFKYVVAGGMESMSQAPYLAPGARDGLRLGHGKFLDSMIHDGLWDPYGDLHMGNCAESCATEYKFSREDQDAYAQESYRRAREATEKGLFAEEIVPVQIPQKKGDPKAVDRDEEPFKSDLSRMGSLKPAFQKDGTVTAANASKINDGAAALVLTTASEAARRGVRPLARVIAHSSLAQEPQKFTTAPGGAVRGGLERAGLKAADIDLWEVNEAFAVVAMAFLRDLEVPADRLNVRGGAVALGHPIGASGARILVTLLHSLRERGGRLGCAAICIGGGEATAMIVERID